MICPVVAVTDEDVGVKGRLGNGLAGFQPRLKGSRFRSKLAPLARAFAPNVRNGSKADIEIELPRRTPTKNFVLSGERGTIRLWHRPES